MMCYGADMAETFAPVTININILRNNSLLRIADQPNDYTIPNSSIRRWIAWTITFASDYSSFSIFVSNGGALANSVTLFYGR